MTEREQAVVTEAIFTVRLLESRRQEAVEYDLLEWREDDAELPCRYLFRVRHGEELALECFDGTRAEATALLEQLCTGHGTPCTLEEILRDRRLEAQLAGR